MKTIPKIQNVCAKDELKPVLNYVFVTKKDTVATDGSIIIIHSTIDLFGNEFASMVPEDGICIHWTDFAKIGGKECSLEWKTEGVIKITYPKARPVFIESIKQDSIGKYPNYMAVIPDGGNNEEITEIGINPSLLLTLTEAITTFKNATVKLTFTGSTRVVIISENRKYPEFKYVKALIVPVEIK
jgi:hypothetical protein